MKQALRDKIPGPINSWFHALREILTRAGRSQNLTFSKCCLKIVAIRSGSYGARYHSRELAPTTEVIYDKPLNEMAPSSHSLVLGTS